MSACPVCNRWQAKEGRQPRSRNGSPQPVLQRPTVCKACKAFYRRYSEKDLSNEPCHCDKKGVAHDDDRDDGIVKCKPCRLRRCRESLEGASGEESKQRETQNQEKEANSKSPCAGCGSLSAEFYCGEVVCDSCSAFLRRYANSKHELICQSASESSESDIGCPIDSKCRCCRFARCVLAGMPLKQKNDRANDRQQSQPDNCKRRLRQKIAVKKTAGSPPNQVIAEKSSPTSSNLADCSEAKPSVSKAQESGSSDTSKKVEPSAPDCQINAKTGTLHHQANSNSHNANNLMALIGNLDWDFYKRLVDQTEEAVSCLVPITFVKVVFNSETPQHEITAQKFRAFVTYLKCISDFLKRLHDLSSLTSENQIAIYLQSFFPVLVVQLSLGFDVANQLPNNLSLDRINGAWQISAATERSHFAIEDYLKEAGNRIVATVTSLKEFSLLCALLCFPASSPRGSDNRSSSSAGKPYEVALLCYLIAHDHTKRHLATFRELVAFMRKANDVFRSYIQDLLSECLLHGQSAESVLVKEFCRQFLTQFNGGNREQEEK